MTIRPTSSAPGRKESSAKRRSLSRSSRRVTRPVHEPMDAVTVVTGDLPLPAVAAPIARRSRPVRTLSAIGRGLWRRRGAVSTSRARCRRPSRGPQTSPRIRRRSNATTAMHGSTVTTIVAASVGNDGEKDVPR